MTATTSYVSSASSFAALQLFTSWLISTVHGSGKSLQVTSTQLNLSIDSWSDADIERYLPNVCSHMVDGVMAQPPILAIGLTQQHLVVVTTELFVFRLPPSLFDDNSLPPYHAFINSHPVHARQLWPESYPTIKTAAQFFLRAGIIGLSIPERPDMSSEYLLLVYKRNGSPCTLALDLMSDKAIEGPCAAELAEESSLLVSMKVPFFGFLLLKDDGQAMCFFLKNGLINSKSMMAGSSQPLPCFAFDKCHVLQCIHPPKKDGLDELSNPFKELQSPIVAVFTVNMTKFYFIDEKHNILSMESSVVPPTRLPLNEFFACYKSKPFEFGFDKLLQIGILAVIIQTIICIFVVLCACYWPIEVAQPEDDEDSKRKSSSKLGRRKSSKRSSKKSVSKSRKSASKAGGDESHSKSATKSRFSKSRKSVSRQSKSTASNATSTVGQSRSGVASKPVY